MLIRYWMSQPVITVNKNDSMQHAASLMKENRIKMLPVIDGGALCGVVTDRDLKRASASDASSLEMHELLYLIAKIKIGSIMTHPAITIDPDWTMEEAAALMLERNISGAPVVDAQGAILGVITQTDLFKATLYITGLKKRGLHVALIIEDSPGSIMEILNVVRQFGGRVTSLLATYERAPAGHRNVYLRFLGVSWDRIDELLKVLGQKTKLRYMVDHDQNRRMVFDKP